MCPVRTLCKMERVMGFEPTTFCMASRCSSQLSYTREKDSAQAGACRDYLTDPG